jgi:hypothetical protein
VDWKRYFGNAKGQGFLATADRRGVVDIAVYSRPHALDDGTLAFGMTSRLTHRNTVENPYAAFAFVEEGAGYSGVRLYLERVGEEGSGPLLKAIRSHAEQVIGPGAASEVAHVVIFKVKKHLPLVGT